MWKKLVQLLSGKDCELREQLFRSIVSVGAILTIIGILEIILVMEVKGILIPMLFVLLVIMGGALFATFKYRKYDVAAILVGFVVVVIVFPVMFFLSGGIKSGASIWMALGILYIFIMFKGRRMFLFLGLCSISYGLTYWMAYRYPQVVVHMSSEAIVYIDSFFSIIVVGIFSGVILKAHMRVFEDEHKINIQQKEELERSSASKNAFFANMSHEIRTPINAIIGLNEMIIRNNPEGETREYADDINLASKMLLNQVNDILDLSQMEMKKMKVIPVKYHTEVLFGDLVELIRVQAEKKKLELYVDVDFNMPSVLVGDEKRIKQVILNILDNAVKYTEEGSITLSAHTEECADGDVMLKISVADTGIGIRKEDMEYLYDSFNRADERRNRRIVGSGLGLAITKQLVDLMEGEITVDSIYRKGTTFTVNIKQKVDLAKPLGVINFLKRATQTGEHYKPSFEAPDARILIVDDNNMNSMVAKKLLSATKVQIDIASSGAECLELTKKKYYHIILLDYMMPGMNGLDTMKALHNQENGLCRDSAVIVLTGNTISGAKQMYEEQGFDGYVEKPVQGKLLEAELLKFLPTDIIESVEEASVSYAGMGQSRIVTAKKRKKVYITADCTCDIPQELLEKYDIKLMYLYVQTPHGRFADTREIDSDSYTRYISSESSTAFTAGVTIEEYEEFFSDVLSEAERVIHISLSSGYSKSYDVAVAAARGFDHVRIIDSGQFSCGQGLVTLYAAKLALEGKPASEICELVEKMKNNVHTRAIIPGADIFYQNGRIGKLATNLCNIMQLHPYVEVRPKKRVFICLLGGSLENSWKHGIRWHLRKKHKISTDVVFITHVGCTVKQLEMIKNEVAKYIKFDRVIVQKASFSVACNVGMEAIGISYYGL